MATTDRPGVLVTLEAERREYAQRVGACMNATYDARGDNFGRLSDGTRVCSSEARCAVEQLLGLRSGTLAAHGGDVYYTPNRAARKVYVRASRRTTGRLFAVIGPFDEGTYLVAGSIEAERAKSRPPAEGTNPRAHVWRLEELDRPPTPRGREAVEADQAREPEQLSLEAEAGA